MPKSNRLNCALGVLHHNTSQLKERVAIADHSRYTPAIVGHLIGIRVLLQDTHRLLTLAEQQAERDMK